MGKKFNRKKFRLIFGSVLLITLLLFTFLKFWANRNTSAAWFDGNWSYRQKLTFGNTGSADSNKKVKFDVDTATLTTDKLLASCDDIRFTDINGNMLRYYLDAGTGACDTNSSDYYVLIPVINTGENVIFMYYGNPSATDAGETAQFSQSTFSPTSGPTFATEENGPAPIAYWELNEGQGTTAQDSSSNNKDGSISGATWQTEDQCISGKCLFFDGSNDVVTVASSVNGIKSVSFWVRLQSISTTQELIDLNGGTDYVTSVSGTITANGFGTETIYINGRPGTTITANTWNHIEITTSSSLTGSAVKIGQVSTNYGQGFIDEVKFYSNERSSSEVKADFNQGAEQMGKQNQQNFLSNGLVGYWKMDASGIDAEGETITDSSGNSNSGTISGDNGVGDNGSGLDCTASGKFGTGCNLDGTDDSADLGSGSSLDISGPITLSAWIKSSSSNSGGIIGKSGGGVTSTQWDFRYTGTGLIFVISNGANVQVNTGNIGLTTGVWYFVTATFDGSTMKIYNNGAQVGTTAFTGTQSTTATNPRIGLGNSAYFPGTIDSVRVYNRALSSTEVASLYNWAPGPIAYYNLDEGSGTTANDTSGNGHTGSLTNGPTWTEGEYGKAVNFDGSDDLVDFYSASFNSNFKPSEGSISVWARVSSSAVWTDATTRYLINIQADTNNRVQILRTTTNNTIRFRYQAGGTDKTVDVGSLSSTGWNLYTITWSSISGIARAYINGLQVGADMTSIGTWSGALATGNVTIGAGANSGTNSWSGQLDDVKVYNYPRTSGHIIEDMNANHPLGGSPIGSQTIYWKFDEQNGTTANNSISGSTNGTISNATWKTKNTCKINGCLSFDGTGDVVTIATASDNNVDFNGSETFSGSAWVYPTTVQGSTTQKAAIIAKYDATTPTRGYRLYLENDDTDSTGNFEVEIYDESTDQIITANSTVDGISANTWYHVAFSFNGGTAGTAGDLKLYVNARPFSNSANTSFLGLEDVTADFTVGEYDATDAAAADIGFTGYIDSVKVYSGLLTDEQIKIDMNAGAGISFSVLGATEASLLTDGAGNYSVGEWNFEENTGTSANDTSGNGNTGTLQGTAGGQWTQGKIGSGMNLNGSDNYLDLTSTIQFDSSPFTVQGWFKTSADTTGNIDELWNSGYSGGNTDIEITIQNNKLIFYPRDSSGVEADPGSATLITSSSVNDNRWHQFAAVRESGNVFKLYLDGVFINSVTTTLGDVDTAGVVPRIGNGLGAINNRYFTGQVDDFKVYNYGRTQAQIAYDYNRGGPRVHWKMNECQGSTLNDSTGNNFPGTITIGASGEDTVGTCNTSSTAWGSGATGKHNASLNFDGTDDYAGCTDATCGGSGNLDLGVSPAFTLTAWAKTSTSGSVIIAGKKNSASSATAGYQMLTSSSNFPVCRVSDGTTQVSPTSTTVTLNDGNWHFIACVANGSTIQTFVDTKFNASSGTTGITGSIDNNQDFRIGATGAGTSHFTGQIDDVRLYRYALSQSQLNQVYNQGAGVRFGPTSGTP